MSSGPDEVWFNPGNNHYFLARSSAGNGLQALGIIDAGTRVADTGIQTAAPINNPPSLHPAAHSVAADSVTGKTFWAIPGNPPPPPQGPTPFGLCSFAGGDDTKGCILVVTGQNDGDDTSATTTTAKKGNGPKNCVAQGAPAMEVSGGEAKHLKVSCD